MFDPSALHEGSVLERGSMVRPLGTDGESDVSPDAVDFDAYSYVGGVMIIVWNNHEHSGEGGVGVILMEGLHRVVMVGLLQSEFVSSPFAVVGWVVAGCVTARVRPVVGCVRTEDAGPVLYLPKRVVQLS